MKILRNPFTTLYVTERLDESKFPHLFSPVLLPYAMSLFEQGNVVVEGTQGTGKSMLLALLRTDIRLAYLNSEKHEYPINELPELCQFIGAGINLATNQALRTATRYSNNNQDHSSDIANTFVDYVNSWILRDLIQSIDQLTQDPNKLWASYKLGGSREDLENAIEDVATLSIIDAYLTKKPTIQAVDQSLTKRIDAYLGFFNGRPKDLPEEIIKSQTISLGQPISEAVKKLVDHNCLNSETKILITIDQFEQLLEMEAKLPRRPYGLLRDTIDQAIHRREPTLSFRIGTRPYAWQQTPGEALRDYHRLDIDSYLRRTEHGNKRLFSDLAKDVFTRRLRLFEYDQLADETDPIKAVMGSYSLPKDRIEKIGPQADWPRVVSTSKEISEMEIKEVERIAESSPLDAKFSVAWFLQKQKHIEGAKFGGNLDELPWNQDKKRWWKKERLWLAILQLAADCRQRIVMHGKKDILDLSGGNILVFASLCQHIWDCWIRDMASNQSAVEETTPINWKLQNDGILNASDAWHSKLKEEGWIGDSLMAFIDEMGTWLREKLVNDRSMSYPGGNGISIANRELTVNKNEQAKRMLSEGAGRGFLLQRKHTPKIRSRGVSTKWYIHPILAPYYELTLNQTKEPRYIGVDVVDDWLRKADILFPSISDAKSDESEALSQKCIPGFDDDRQGSEE